MIVDNIYLIAIPIKDNVIFSLVYEENGELFEYETGIRITNKYYITFVLEPFEIDEEGYELVAFILVNDIGEIKILIFQKNSDGKMKVVFPRGMTDIEMTRGNFKVRRVTYPKIKNVNLIPLDQNIKLVHDFNGNKYSKINIDDIFVFSTMLERLTS